MWALGGDLVLSRISESDGKVTRLAEVRHANTLTYGMGALWVVTTDDTVLRVDPQCAHPVGQGVELNARPCKARRLTVALGDAVEDEIAAEAPRQSHLRQRSPGRGGASTARTTPRATPAQSAD